MKALVKYRKNSHEKYVSFFTDLQHNNPLEVVLFTMRRTDAKRFEVVIEKVERDKPLTLDAIYDENKKLEDFEDE